MLPSTVFYKRFQVIIVAACLAMAIIVGRLFHLQVTQSLVFFRKSQQNFLRFENITSPRGAILDINGIPLATNRPVITVYWQGTGHKSLNHDQEMVLTILETLLETNISVTSAAINSAEKHAQKIPLVADISFDQLSRVLEQIPAHPNIVIDTHFKRFYPYFTLACHALGYINNLQQESIGKMGLEKIYEEQLKGMPGKSVKTINSIGKFMGAEEVHKAAAGHNLQTTLDLALQKIAEEVFPSDCRGTCIVMNPKQGDIYALVSRPSFDPNIFLSTLNQETWDDLKTTKPFLNRACNVSYPPASLFKLVTIAAAIENGFTTEETNWYCPGHSTFGGRTYYCNNHKGHGVLTTKEALAKSCNIPFYEVGKRIKIDVLAEYANRFGLGQKTNISLPEETGLIPTSQWKRRVKKEPWWPGETLSAMIGQSYLLATPMQIAVMISAICEGSLVTPRILQEEPIQKKPLNILPSTRKFLKKSMLRVITDGSGRRLNKLRNMKIYAKTGTAQVSSLDLREKDSKYLEHAWFVTHLRYKDNEPLVLVLLVENVGSSMFSVDIAKKFIIEYCKYCNTKDVVPV